LIFSKGKREETAAAGFTLTDWEIDSIRFIFSSISVRTVVHSKESSSLGTHVVRYIAIHPLGLFRQKRIERIGMNKTSGDNIVMAL
jgi:hypothetical protein